MSTPIIDINDDRLGKILITSIPNGDAPKEIKEEWLGLELPYVYTKKNAQALSVVKRGEKTEEIDSYCVLQTHAIAILANKSLIAAKWWSDKGFPESEDSLFLFSIDCAEEVKPGLSHEDLANWKN